MKLLEMTSGSTDEIPAKDILLKDLPLGEEGRIAGLEGPHEDCQRLREMGFCESAIIKRISGERMMMCKVCGTKIALNEALGKKIRVERLRQVD
ncbi:MAG: ferrous iron transport protein A [Opitutaceae bacterium]|nr:ferrous iron transport protein A [Opitutaceae bacterium]